MADLAWNTLYVSIKYFILWILQLFMIIYILDGTIIIGNIFTNYFHPTLYLYVPYNINIRIVLYAIKKIFTKTNKKLTAQ